MMSFSPVLTLDLIIIIWTKWASPFSSQTYGDRRDRGAQFENLDNGFNREIAVKDIGAFLDWIDTDSRLDKNRIGVKGASYGGYMTLASLYHYGIGAYCGDDRWRRYLSTFSTTEIPKSYRDTPIIWFANGIKGTLPDERFKLSPSPS